MNVMTNTSAPHGDDSLAIVYSHTYPDGTVADVVNMTIAYRVRITWIDGRESWIGDYPTKRIAMRDTDDFVLANAAGHVAPPVLPTDTFALGVAIEALKTYGSIINGQNAYSDEITVLTAMRARLYAERSVQS